MPGCPALPCPLLPALSNCALVQLLCLGTGETYILGEVPAARTFSCVTPTRTGLRNLNSPLILYISSGGSTIYKPVAPVV